MDGNAQPATSRWNGSRQMGPEIESCIYYTSRAVEATVRHSVCNLRVAVASYQRHHLSQLDLTSMRRLCSRLDSSEVMLRESCSGALHDNEAFLYLLPILRQIGRMSKIAAALKGRSPRRGAGGLLPWSGCRSHLVDEWWTDVGDCWVQLTIGE